MEEKEVETYSSHSTILKTTPIIRDLTLNPSCDHGPSILFERNGTRFFACSAYRCRKLCWFYMPEDKWEEMRRSSGETVERKLKRYLEGGDESSVGGESHKKIKLHETVNHPLSSPKQRDKGEAQYHFNDTTVEFFMNQIKSLEIDSILCIGTPSLHQHMSASRAPDCKSFLLDIDQRFNKLYKGGFSLYNMCNHHFFHDKLKYMDFLKNSRKLAVILDPPFGVKVDLIWHGCIQGIQRDLLQLRNKNNVSSSAGNQELEFEVMWIFPYFMEGHILKCPGAKLEMSDFHVEYRNHTKYRANASSSKSSPIRIFTTIPLSQMTLPKDNYRYCDVCTKWVDKRNVHCKVCGMCTTKDGGGTYIHCKVCKKCAKPTWKHCPKCGTCHLANSECKKSVTHYNLGKASSNPDSFHSKRNILYKKQKKRNKK